MWRTFVFFGVTGFGVLGNCFGQLQREPFHDDALIGFQGRCGILQNALFMNGDRAHRSLMQNLG